VVIEGQQHNGVVQPMNEPAAWEGACLTGWAYDVSVAVLIEGSGLVLAMSASFTITFEDQTDAE